MRSAGGDLYRVCIQEEIETFSPTPPTHDENEEKETLVETEDFQA